MKALWYLNNHFSHEFVNEIKNKWPQMNNTTDLEFVQDHVVEFVLTEKLQALTEKFESTKLSLKENLSTQLGVVINDRNILIKTLAEEFRQACAFFTKEAYELKLFVRKCTYNRDLDDVIFCYYHPETDTLYVKEK